MLCLKWATGLEVLRGSQLPRKFPWERWLYDYRVQAKWHSFWLSGKLYFLKVPFLKKRIGLPKRVEMVYGSMPWTEFYWETPVMFECESCYNIMLCACCHNWIWELYLFLEAIYWGRYVLVFIHSMPLKQPGLQLRICLIQTARWKHVMLHFIF